MRISFSENADADIQEIYEYLCYNFNSRIADEKVNGIYKSIKYLADNPFMGRSVDGHDQNLRQLCSPPNIILYDVTDTAVEILHVVDGRMNYKKKLKI